VKHFIIGAIAAAIAFYGLTRLLPQFVDYTGSIEGLIVLGVIFGVVNGLIGPVVKTLSIPLSMLTMGVAGVLVNAGLLLLVAIIAQSTGFDLQIGDFPPDLFTADTIVAAVIGSVVIGLVTGVVNAVVP
jgi:putative membrane protein